MVWLPDPLYTNVLVPLLKIPVKLFAPERLMVPVVAVMEVLPLKSPPMVSVLRFTSKSPAVRVRFPV